MASLVDIGKPICSFAMDEMWPLRAAIEADLKGRGKELVSTE